jgi:catechol 2,3-dioxygenase-like lactoylglutathione lyase family enzyme
MLRDAPIMAILPAADIERAKSFYQETLNLRQLDYGVGDDAAFECGDGTKLYIYAKEGGTKAEHTVAGWLVEDVEKTVEELRQKGVVFEKYDMPGLKTDEHGIAEMDDAKVAWFKDTEGNILSVTSRPE